MKYGLGDDSSIAVRRLKVNGEYKYVVDNGVLSSDLEKILERVDSTQSLLVEDINPSISKVNCDTSYSSEKLNCQKVKGIVPYLLVPGRDLKELFNALKSRYKTNSTWKKMTLEGMVKRCLIKVTGQNNDGEYIFPFTTYTPQTRKSLIPYLQEKVPSIKLNINSEKFSLHGICGLDFHGKERVFCAGDLVSLKALQEFNATNILQAFRDGNTHPYLYDINTNPELNLCNTYVKYTTLQNGLYVKRMTIGYRLMLSLIHI